MRAIVIAIAFALALAPFATAQECEPTTSQPEIDTGANPVGPRYYVDNDYCQMCMFSIWVYQESNGIDGLQRGDEVVDDTCGGEIPHDEIIF